VLLEGVPGLAKTLSIRTLATATAADFKRIQFTPDLLPADIIGTLIYSPKENTFHTRKGPIFANMVLADEINRAPAKVQSALLEAMQERQVTIGDTTYPLPSPFLVLATENPIDQEGTYPLPEAQLDRFLMQIDVEYPDEATERQIILATTSNQEGSVKAVLNAADLLEIQSLVRDMPIGEKVVDAIIKLVRGARPGEGAHKLVNEYVTWAPGPRGSQGLMLATRAKALLDGRSAPSIDDVVDLAEPILRHRMALNFKARANGVTTNSILKALCETL
jgi:MoxR-like ATPase